MIPATLESEQKILLAGIDYRPARIDFFSHTYGEYSSRLRRGYEQNVLKIENTYDIFVPGPLLEICKEIDNLGGRALIVGGMVRDAVIAKELQTGKIEPKDYDLEVYGLDLSTLFRVLELKFGKTDAVGRAFGIIKVRVPGINEPVDFSIPRSDSKVASGHTGFEVTGNPAMGILDAAKRRDLTINSLAYDPLTKTLYDSFGGVNDIQNKTIDVTNEIAFQEDPLRVLRIMQFMARFNFTVTDRTLNLCAEMVARGDLDELPSSRVTEELKKLFLKGKRPSIGLEFARKVGIVEKYWPELYALIDCPQNPDWHPEGDIWIHTLQVTDAAADIIRREQLDDDEKTIVMLSALCHDFGKPATTEFMDGRWKSHGHEEAGVEPAKSFLKKFNFNVKTYPAITALIRNHLKPKEFYDLEMSGKDMGKALRRLAVKLDQAGTSIKMLSLVAQADQRGRNGVSRESLLENQVPGLSVWKEWLSQKSVNLKIETKAPQRLITGDEIMAVLGITNTATWIGVIVKSIYADQLDGLIVTREDALQRAGTYAENFKVVVDNAVTYSNEAEADVWGKIVRMDDPREFLN